MIKWVKNFGQKLKAERLAWGMSIKKLSKLSHVDIETITDIENGININPNFYDILNICEVLDTSIYFYIEEEDFNNDEF